MYIICSTSKAELPDFAIVEFEDGIEVIRTSWAVLDHKDDEQMVASYFPPCGSKKDLLKILVNRDKQPCSEWADDQMKPWPVLRVLRYASE